MQIAALGPLAIDGRAVEGTRLPALLLPLLLARGRIVPVTQLIEAVWDGEPPADPVGALQALVTRTRRWGLTVTATGGGYRLEPDGLDVDVLIAQDLLGRARVAMSAQDHALAAAEAASALELWTAADPSPTDGSAGRMYRDLVALRIEAALAIGGPPAPDDVGRLEDAVRHLPTDEPLVALLMRALAAHGRDAEALEVYERLRAHLGEHYGTDPSAPVAITHVALLRGELTPTANPAAVRPAPTGSPRHDLAPRTALPLVWRRPTTPLVGRETDIVELERLLTQHPLVTLVAVGGAGKTRLAAEIATRASRHGAPVHAVELAGVRDPSEVLPAVLTALGAAESASDGPDPLARRALTPQERMRRAVASLGGLLVLDNCEHLLEAVADVASRLLEAAGPDLRLLATSRAPLGIVGEAVHPVATLPDRSALALLESRGRAGRPGLAWDPEIGLELCHRLDNLPLAIELAAARLRSMSLADVLTGVDHRFTLLTGALRGLPDRHQGLWAMVDWSWALLDQRCRTLLRDLAVIPAPFTAEMAATVSGLDGDTATREGLTVLVEQSLLFLVEAEDGRPTRYRMLETVREYGESRLVGEGARDEVMARLASWAAVRARELREDYVGDGQLAALAATADDHDALTAGLRWAVDHGRETEAFAIAAGLLTLWTLRGLHLEVLVWARSLLNADDHRARRRTWEHLRMPGSPDAPDPDDAAVVGALTGMTAAITHDLRLGAIGMRLARWSVGGTPDGVRPGHRSATMVAVAVALSSGQDVQQAEAVNLLMAERDPYLHGMGFFLRAMARENDGDLHGSAQDARAAYAFFESIGDHWGMGMAAQGVGQWASPQDGEQADEWLTRAIEHFDLVGDVDDAGSLLIRRDLRRALLGSADAITALEVALQSRSASPQERAHAGIGLGVLAALRGDWEEAVERADLAVSTARHDVIPVPQSLIMVEVAAAVLRIRAGLDGEALLAVAAHAAFGVADMPVLGSVAQGYAELAASRGEAAMAGELWALGARLGAQLETIFGSLLDDARRTGGMPLPPESVASGTALATSTRGISAPQAVARLEALIRGS